MDGKRRFGVVALSKVWALKYRPKLDEIVGQDQIFQLGLVKQHYLLYSPGAGTGKTSLAHALAEEWGYVLHEYNASSKKTRGIEFVEEELMPMSTNGRYTQVFLLDEADQLTPAAQSALKGVIENAQGYFILTCNDLSKISPYLKSRCCLLEFQPINDADMKHRLEYICGREGVAITEGFLNVIIKANKGDLRSAINALQAYHAAWSKSIPDAEKFIRSIGEEAFDCKSFLTLCFRDKDFAEALKMLFGVTGTPVSARRAVKQIFDFAVNNENATSDSKLKVVEATVMVERDFIAGVESDVALAEYVRTLC